MVVRDIFILRDIFCEDNTANMIIQPYVCYVIIEIEIIGF